MEFGFDERPAAVCGFKVSMIPIDEVSVYFRCVPVVFCNLCPALAIVFEGVPGLELCLAPPYLFP